MRYIVLLLVLLIGAGFVFINWPAVNAPVEVNLLITTAKAPITLMLLFWFSLLFVIVIYILFVQQTGSFATMRRLTKELQEQRKQLTEGVRRSLLFTHGAELVLHERMVNDMKFRETRISFHSFSPINS